MARWYSVSASSSPATKAPSAIDNPAAAVASPLPTATNRAAATNSSVLSTDATSRNSGRRITVPTSTMAAMTRMACPKACKSPPISVPLFSGPRMVTRNNSGTTARSCNSRIAKQVRPVPVLSRCLRERISITMAVEDSASEMPMSTAPPGRAPRRLAIMPIKSAEIVTCSVPSPNTSRRIVTRRLNDSSSPIRNNRNTTPRSAMAPSPRSSVMATQRTAGKLYQSEPRPPGPSSAPAMRKPRIGLILKRWPRGTRTAAVPSTIIASR